VDAVIDLARELTWAGLSSLPAAQRLTGAALLAVAANDGYVSVADIQRSYAAIPSPNKKLAVLPASAGHGWLMLQTGTTWSSLATQAASTIRRAGHQS
jgi:hypothetical protein